MGKFIIEILNALIEAIAIVFSWILSLLPNSPFQTLSNSGVSEFLSSLNWLIPLSAMIAIFQAWLTAIIGYYIVMLILRWIKAIE